MTGETKRRKGEAAKAKEAGEAKIIVHEDLDARFVTGDAAHATDVLMAIYEAEAWDRSGTGRSRSATAQAVALSVTACDF